MSAPIATLQPDVSCLASRCLRKFDVIGAIRNQSRYISHGSWAKAVQRSLQASAGGMKLQTRRGLAGHQQPKETNQGLCLEKRTL